MLILFMAWTGALLGPFVLWRLWRRDKPLSAALLAALYILGVWSALIEPRLLIVRHVTIESAAWRGPPLRVGVLSDTHAGSPHVTPERVARVATRLSAERPDIVVLLGDYAGRAEPATMRSVPQRSAVLRGIAALAKARAPLGRVGVLGNHDWWYGAGDIIAGLNRAGVTLLQNRAVRIPRSGGAFWVAGLTDMDAFAGEPNPSAAVAAVPPGDPVIVLAHEPDAWPQIPARAALTLAGHSHCGQVWLPFLGRPVEPSPGSRRWPCGRYEQGGRILYVTGGLGTSILPVRLATPPEIVIVTLRSRP